MIYKLPIFFQYRKYGTDLCNLLDGMFSFVLLDESVSPSRIIAARDPIGVTTLYQGWSSERPGAVFFASELKALVNDCDTIVSFPPGHVYDSHDRSTTRYYRPKWWDGDSERPDAVIPTESADLSLIRETLEAAVRKRLMSEVPYGVLLSGGLDSSLIAAIASRETEKVAQAQFELRRKKHLEASSGPSTPNNSSVLQEQGRSIFWPGLQLLMFPLSYPRRLATVALVFHRFGKFARSKGGQEGSALPWNCASRIRIHSPGRVGCNPRGNISFGNL